ncbi:MAG: hypothetical protein ACLPVY_05015 [Acidimicrobiia bacterium]
MVDADNVWHWWPPEVSSVCLAPGNRTQRKFVAAAADASMLDPVVLDRHVR